MAVAKRALGRGLSALIPDEEMEMLRRVARDDSTSDNLASLTIKAPVAGTPAAGAVAAGAVAAGAVAAGVKSRKVEKGDTTPATAREVVQLHAPNSYMPETPRGKTVSISADQNNAEPHDGKVSDVGATETNAVAAKNDGSITSFVPISDIEPNPYQPRRSFDESELNNLAASITEHGIIQPIVVRPTPDGAKPYQLVAGERRWRASQRAGLQQIPAIVRPVNDLQALELALIENVQRHDISAIDAALAYRRLADDFQLSQEDIARRVGKSRSAVANTMRLLDLQPEIRKAIEDGHLSEGHGRAILLAQGDGARRALFRRITRDHLSVREVERLAKTEGRQAADSTPSGQQSTTALQGESASGAKTRENGFDATQLATRLEKRLGTRLKVQPGARGGRIVIEYSSVQELERLTELLLPS